MDSDAAADYGNPQWVTVFREGGGGGGGAIIDPIPPLWSRFLEISADHVSISASEEVQFILIISGSREVSSVFDIGLLKSPLEDDLVQDALRKGTDLRQYSKQIEKELQDVENASIAGIYAIPGRGGLFIAVEIVVWIFMPDSMLSIRYVTDF